MYNFSTDPFKVETIPKFRNFEISIVRPPAQNSDATYEFVSTIKAINQVKPPEPVPIPPRGQFFDFATISDYEKQFPFAANPIYKDVRNFMVAISQIFSNRYVPFTLYRRNIKAPINFTYAVWKFLTDHGLINYACKPNTRPQCIVPDATNWPHLLYTHDDTIMSESTYDSKINPTPNIPPNPIQPFSLMCAPYFTPERSRKVAEVSSIMHLGNWTLDENNRMNEVLKELNRNPDIPSNNWQAISDLVSTRTPEDCAQQVAMYPITAFEFEKPPLISYKEFAQPKELIRDEVLKKNKEMRIVYKATEVLGEEKSAKIIRGEKVDEIDSAEAGAAAIALEKIKANTEVYRAQQKKKMLAILRMIVDTTKQSIACKTKMISERGQAQVVPTTDSDGSTDDFR
ncbi:SWIRM domain containing protein [Trichomonas vaginalis G3]|uniref:SWIRM domain containing protein n=1 Tax=Trichomonas vaginalis (strain ATCC PRA-98 / G3) TaxID=412133 RepID=A2FEB2_TRIV3|nr:chromatin remodeling [Trichomonas vaginalis G3]EAX96752.1 SWIRM domain containing protein [Trichomonas vaginalis G3]KAI5520167.1 chromatin remodeling [Trichomonas vaginalis G3]|eukprot:XP_001309682.1 SWIRM domain containing protein [Trichomonas vaginalis G3]